MCGIKWIVLRNENYTGAPAEPLEDPVLVSFSKCLEAGDVTTKSEDPEDPHDPEDLGHPPHLVLVLSGALHVAQRQGDEVGNNPQEVNHVHPLPEKLPLLRGSDASHQVLNSEPGDEDCLCDGKVTMFVCLICFRIRDLEYSKLFTQLHSQRLSPERQELCSG